jgi:hypothetical protein
LGAVRTVLCRFIISSLGSGFVAQKPGSAEPTRRNHRNARFSSLFRQAEWLSMHDYVKEI